MDDIKKQNKPIKIKVNHYTDKENEGIVSPKSQLAAESIKSNKEDEVDIDLNDIDLESESSNFKTPQQASNEDAITDPKIDSEV